MNTLSKLFSRRTDSQVFILEPDAKTPHDYTSSTKPCPTTFAYFQIWSEAKKKIDMTWTFDKHAVLDLIHDNLKGFDSTWFVWDRFIEWIRLSCRLPHPHLKNEEKGTAFMSMHDGETGRTFEGAFEISHDWSVVKLTLTEIKTNKEGTNQSTHTTSANARLFDNEPLEINEPKHGGEA